MTTHSHSQRVVGLQYRPEQGLPTVTVKGSGPLAEELLQATLSPSGPRLVRDPELLEKLYRLPIDATIDFALFEIVAQVLTHVFAVNAQIQSRESAPTMTHAVNAVNLPASEQAQSSG